MIILAIIAIGLSKLVYDDSCAYSYKFHKLDNGRAVYKLTKR